MQKIIHRVSPGGATKLHTPGAKSAIIPDCLVTSLVMSTSVCLSVSPQACLQSDMRNLYQPFCAMCMLPMAVARSSTVSVMKSQGEGAFLSDFLPH